MEEEEEEDGVSDIIQVDGADSVSGSDNDTHSVSRSDYDTDSVSTSDIDMESVSSYVSTMEDDQSLISVNEFSINGEEGNNSIESESVSDALDYYN